MINALLDHIIHTLAPLFPESVSIARYNGRFTERDLDRFAGRAPALLISAQRLEVTGCNVIPVQTLHPGDSEEVLRKRIEGRLHCAIAILTKDRPGQSRDAVALELVNTLIITLPQQTFDAPLSRGVTADSIRAQNLHTVSLDNKAVTLWGVTFIQPVRMDVGQPPVFDTPARVMLGIEPEIGPDHVDDYTDIQRTDLPARSAQAGDGEQRTDGYE